MKKFWIVLVVIIGCCSDTFAQPEMYGCHYFRNREVAQARELAQMDVLQFQNSIARSDTFDVIHYNINLDVTDYNNEFIDGFTTVTFEPKMDDLDYINFDLFALNVDSVIVNGESLAFSYDNEILHVELNEVVNIGEEIDVTVHYNGNPYRDPYWGGFYFQNDYIYNLGIGLTTIPPYFGKVWYPCFDSFVERATYEYHIISSEGKKAFCQGEFLGEEVIQGDTIMRSYALDQPIPTHISAIAVSTYESTETEHEGANGTIPITLTSKASAQESMSEKFTNIGACIDALEWWYGPYVWSRVGYVITTDGALEIPTNIAYPGNMLSQSLNANEGLYSHELGHHWFGDLVTPDIHNNMWLKEGPAEYSSHLFVEWLEGEDEFVEVVKDNQLFVLEQAHIDDNGFHPMSPMPDEEIYGRHTYYKGASVLHNMRGYLGDSLFREAMTVVNEDFAYNHMSPEDFRDKITEVTGFDMTDFFNDQIFQTGFSTFVIDSMNTAPNGGDFINTVYVQQKLRECPEYYSNVPIDVTFYDNNWEPHHYITSVGGHFTTLDIPTSFEPLFVSMNARNRLNQARMDHQQSFTEPSSLLTIPYVDFKVKVETISDSILFRAEHQWAAPDNENVADYIDEMSSTHYWIFGGINNGDATFSGRVYYYGSDEYDLDQDLVSETEYNLIMVYRASPEDMWEEVQDYEKVAGNETNGTGYFKIYDLPMGEYAFANASDEWVGVKDVAIANEGLLLYPNPADNRLVIDATFIDQHDMILQIHDMNGRLLLRETVQMKGENLYKEIQLSEFQNGVYVVSIAPMDRRMRYTETFEVLR